MEKLKKITILNVLGIASMLGGTSILVAMGILNAWAFILVTIACFTMAKQLWQIVGIMRRNTIRLLSKTLPKVGFSIENTEWNDQHTALRFIGKYKGDNFIVEAVNEYAFVMIYNMPWQEVKTSDPIMPKLMEAVNEVNAGSSNMSVIVCEPNDEGMRSIYTLCKTIIPTYRTELYLDSLMCDMLNRKPALIDAINKERPYMAQRRGPIGFSVQKPLDRADEPVVPAAKNDSEVKN